jgi:hypothetical protein
VWVSRCGEFNKWKFRGYIYNAALNSHWCNFNFRQEKEKEIEKFVPQSKKQYCLKNNQLTS